MDRILLLFVGCGKNITYEADDGNRLVGRRNGFFYVKPLLGYFCYCPLILNFNVAEGVSQHIIMYRQPTVIAFANTKRTHNQISFSMCGVSKRRVIVVNKPTVCNHIIIKE